jgi:UrcA family protein
MEIVMVRKLIPATVILFSLGLGSAMAGSTSVTYSDLNLATPTGTAALTERVTTAAAAYCASADKHLVSPAFAAPASAACIKQITGIALASIKAPQQLALR